MSGRPNCNPHRFQPSMGETRTTRALSIRIVCRSFTFLRMGAEGISSDIRDRRRKGLRIASSAPPALSFEQGTEFQEFFALPVDAAYEDRYGEGESHPTAAFWNW